MSAKKSIDDFIIENHSTVPESLLPQNVKLKQPFAVCIIGASRGMYVLLIPFSTEATFFERTIVWSVR